MTYSPYMPVDTVDDTADMTDMQGPSSTVNQLGGKASWANSPTKCLIALWGLALGLYWFMGWFFRGHRS